MLSRQLVRASLWQRTPACHVLAVRSPLRPPPCRPFSATATALKRTGNAPKGKKAKASAKTREKEAAGDAHDDDVDKREHKHVDSSPKSLKDALLGDKETVQKRRNRDRDRDRLDIISLDADGLEFEAVDVGKPPVPMLSYGLDRVLFNPGVYRLQDPRSRVYNFDPYLEKIMPAHEFDFEALSEYKTSSRDEELLALTRRIGAKYTGSTSSMSAVLQHFHYILSNFRKLQHSMLSRQFPDPSPRFSKITLGPSAVFLRYKAGIYAIDADKSYDRPNIMSWLGHSLEKLLTTERSEFERYRRSSPEQAPTEDNGSRCYHYSKQGNIMMRSQLDAVDPRLPGTGVFDLKTRAVVSIRMNHKEYEEGAGYQLRHALGEWESFEREFYDMTRATLLKYSLQVRMGRMDGIFLAYHNIERIFGFQYLSLPEMDAVLHGQHDTALGDQEFKLSISLVDQLLSKATAMFPNTTLRLHFEARDTKTPFMYVFAEPVTDEQADAIQSAGEAAQKAFARNVVGLGRDDPKTQAEWQDIQDDVDEQVGEDQNSISTSKDPKELSTEEEHLTDSERVSEEESEEEAKETATTKEHESIPTAASEGPLMGWTLTVRSLVNGGYVERPTNFTDDDEWKIEYHIKEIPEENRWKLYNAVRERRRQLVGQDDEEADKNLKTYRDLISRFSRRGRKWREEQDKIDQEKGVEIFRPLGPGSDAVRSDDEVTRPKTEKDHVNDEMEKPEPTSEEPKLDEPLSQQKKEEILDGVPSSPS
ncbi:mitochondrial membrane protein pet127 [Stemphylium lycopersici]|nr:mitochondrial membrane protein pet127 [Stemphylium lycopersici]RAR06917.1 mitochondrial membrane protein pet127 [Stemphylium lycopersici]